MKLNKNQKILVLSVIVAVVPIAGGIIFWWGGMKEDVGYIKGANDSQKGNSNQPISEILNNSFEHESYFDDNDWEINGQWQKDKKTLACEPSPITERDGGPKMTNINYFASSDFHIKVEFVPKSNSDEINFVIYIGNSYRMVLGDGNRKFF